MKSLRVFNCGSSVIKLIVLFMFVYLFLLTPVGNAETLGNIHVEPVIKDTQRDKIKSYFYRETGATDYKETLEFLVSNRSESEVTVSIYPVNALISPTGVIDYNPNKTSLTSTLIDETSYFTQYAKLDKSIITLDASSSKHIFLEVEIPNIQGTVIGGLAFKTIKESEETENTNFKIEQEVVNAIAIVVNKQGFNDKPLLDFGELNVVQLGEKFFINIPTTLASNTLITKAVVAYKVWNKKGEELFTNEILDGYNFTPNSFSDIKLPWKSNELELGADYTVKGYFLYILNGEEVKAPFSREVHITGEGFLQEENVMTVLVNKSYWWIYLLIGLLILSAIIAYKKTKPYYILPSNSNTFVRLISSSNPLFSEVVTGKAADFENKYEYLHIYSKRNKRENGNKVTLYEYKKSVKL